ncbi:hypothetical protein RCH20_001196 [Psychrobacter sp. PL15]|nr:hypothetical protein [Psychrobacter sp. PL15]
MTLHWMVVGQPYPLYFNDHILDSCVRNGITTNSAT